MSLSTNEINYCLILFLSVKFADFWNYNNGDKAFKTYNNSSETINYKAKKKYKPPIDFNIWGVYV